MPDLNDRLDVSEMTIEEVVETFSRGAAEYNESKLVSKLKEREAAVLRHERGLRTLAEEARDELNVRLNAIGGGSMTHYETEQACWRACLIAMDVCRRHGLDDEWFRVIKSLSSDEGYKMYKLTYEEFPNVAEPTEVRGDHEAPRTRRGHRRR